MFTHLHLHSDASILDAIITVKKLIDKCVTLSMPAIAITDHGSVGNAIKFYQLAKEKGIKPIIGMEAYLSPTDDHTLRQRLEDLPDYYHLTLLARNQKGVEELFRLSTLGYTEGFYSKPRISLPLVESIGKNLIILSACVRGPIAWHLVEREDLDESNTKKEKKQYLNEDLAYEKARRLKKLFPERFFIEVMDHRLSWQEELNKKLIGLSETLSIPWVPTNDCHFLEKKDHKTHEIMMCIQLRKSLPELLESGMTYSNQCYIKSEEEMRELFPQDALDRTSEIGEMVDISLNLGISIFPEF